MSMTEQFFSVKYAERGDLFEGLSIWQEEKYRGLQGTYPVLRVSKESFFSDLNNLKVVTTTSDEYGAAFGFTEEEVFAALYEYQFQQPCGETDSGGQQGCLTYRRLGKF